MAIRYIYSPSLLSFWQQHHWSRWIGRHEWPQNDTSFRRPHSLSVGMTIWSGTCEKRPPSQPWLPSVSPGGIDHSCLVGAPLVRTEGSMGRQKCWEAEMLRGRNVEGKKDLLQNTRKPKAKKNTNQRRISVFLSHVWYHRSNEHHCWMSTHLWCRIDTSTLLHAYPLTHLIQTSPCAMFTSFPRKKHMAYTHSKHLCRARFSLFVTADFDMF